MGSNLFPWLVAGYAHGDLANRADQARQAAEQAEAEAARRHQELVEQQDRHGYAMWRQTPLGQQWDQAAAHARTVLSQIAGTDQLWTQTWKHAGPELPSAARSTGKNRLIEVLVDEPAFAGGVLGVLALFLFRFLFIGWPLLITCVGVGMAPWVLDRILDRKADEAAANAADRWQDQFGFAPAEDGPIDGGRWCEGGSPAKAAQIRKALNVHYTNVTDAHVEALQQACNVPLATEDDPRWPPGIVDRMARWRAARRG